MPDLEKRAIPAANPVIGDAEFEAAVRELRSGMVVQGPEALLELASDGRTVDCGGVEARS
jgi:hypothetical protein